MSDYANPIYVGRKTRPAGFPETMDAADFIGVMCQQFRVYHKEGSAEEAQWTDAMIAVLSVYDPEVLADGCLWFWQHRKELRFPLSAEIITVCDELTKERKRPTLLKQADEKVRASPYSEDRTNLVRHLLRAGPMGRQAVQENWIGALGDWVRVNGRLPEPAVIPGLKHSSRETTEAIERVYRGAGMVPSMLPMLQKAMGSIEARRREYAAMVLGDEA